MKEQLKNIGKKTSISVNGLRVFVRILDFKSSYGHERWLVSPVSGEGQVWVENIFP